MGRFLSPRNGGEQRIVPPVDEFDHPGLERWVERLWDSQARGKKFGLPATHVIRDVQRQEEDGFVPVLFDVDDYRSYVRIQSESAVRHLASIHPYDAESDDAISLRRSTSEISVELKKALDARFTSAGVEVLEARLTHLAYAPEIAHAMLQRQQAAAVVSARETIVDGAVGMVKIALAKLQGENVVELDNERKAAMVSNLLVTLCSDQATHPVVNTGTACS